MHRRPAELYVIFSIVIFGIGYCRCPVIELYKGSRKPLRCEEMGVLW